MSVVSVILGNLLGFDLLIFAAAVGNGFLYAALRRRAGRLYRELNRFVFLPLRQGEDSGGELGRVDLEDLVRQRQEAEALYGLFANVTAIFPLLGILGTVISLLPMVADMADVQNNFFAALTSTFWGLVYAIGFKLADGFLAPRMEDNDKSLTLLLERFREGRA